MFRKMQFYQRMLLIVVAWSALIAAPQAFAYKQITAGTDYTCGLKNDGSVACWGSALDSISDTFTQIEAGGFRTCGLNNGGAACWSSFDYSDRAIVPGGTFTQLSAGRSHTCGLRSDGRAVCWEDNSSTLSC